MRRKNFNLKVFIQYLLTIVNVFVSFIYLVINYNGSYMFFSFFVQSFICLSSNLCSVACTISYLIKNDEDNEFQNKRTIFIVSSLVLNLVLTIYLTKENLIIGCSEWFVLALVGFILIYILYEMIDMQRSVEIKNNKTVSCLTKNEKKYVDEAKKQKIGTIAGETYNIVGDE